MAYHFGNILTPDKTSYTWQKKIFKIFFYLVAAQKTVFLNGYDPCLFDWEKKEQNILFHSSNHGFS
jgi:hypothetical protein